MAHPWIFESNFEQGTAAEWTSETDVEGLLTFPHYTQLARHDQTIVGPIAPYRGAYVAQWRWDGTQTDNFVLAGAIDVALNATRFVRFYLFLGKDLVATVADNFNIFTFSSGATEGVVALRVETDNDIFIGVGETGFANPSLRIERGRYYCVEVEYTPDAAAGSIALYVDGALINTITTLTNAATIQGVLGNGASLLSTTTGHMFVSDFVFDDTRIYPYKERYPDNVWITKTQHVFVGPGWIDEAAITSAAGSLILYDTDKGDINNAEAVVDLNTAEGRVFFDGGAEFKRGCYAVLSPGHEAEVRISTGAPWAGQYGPGAHWAAGAVRRYGSLR